MSHSIDVTLISNAIGLSLFLSATVFCFNLLQPHSLAFICVCMNQNVSSVRVKQDIYLQNYLFFMYVPLTRCYQTPVFLINAMFIINIYLFYKSDICFGLLPLLTFKKNKERLWLVYRITLDSSLFEILKSVRYNVGLDASNQMVYVLVIHVIHFIRILFPSSSCICMSVVLISSFYVTLKLPTIVM